MDPAKARLARVDVLRGSVRKSATYSTLWGQVAYVRRSRYGRKVAARWHRSRSATHDRANEKYRKKKGTAEAVPSPSNR